MSLTTTKPPSGKNSTRNANRVFMIAALVAPSPESTRPIIPSLMQTILYCNFAKVKEILDALENLAEDDKLRKKLILEDRNDGNRNILHVAVMNAFSFTNKAQADIDFNENTKQQEQQNSNRSKFERRWQEMIPPEIAKQYNKPSKESKGIFLKGFVHFDNDLNNFRKNKQ